MPLVPDNPSVGFIYSFTRPFEALNKVVIAEQQDAAYAVSFIIDTRRLKNIHEIRTNGHFTRVGQAHQKHINTHDEIIFQDSPVITGTDPQGRCAKSNATGNNVQTMNGFRTRLLVLQISFLRRAQHTVK
jgi:hypothetical protein